MSFTHILQAHNNELNQYSLPAIVSIESLSAIGMAYCYFLIIFGAHQTMVTIALNMRIPKIQITRSISIKCFSSIYFPYDFFFFWFLFGVLFQLGVLLENLTRVHVQSQKMLFDIAKMCQKLGRLNALV